ncbi:hypothetical protein LJY25_01830 [Hymenobacter sp. BT175]|uniref:hypothetical protein n=1 Tax=Hymenobacter translucens TaxID=2886507 RepID=UPI001D0E09EC|nr:hypothetical protein [Hymenobacter translucens]MCC2545171.1 hypothetical protein [Hymenobacter translucens]
MKFLYSLRARALALMLLTAPFALSSCGLFDLVEPEADEQIPSGYTEQGTITVTNGSLQICARDFGTIDGDVIDILIDGTTYKSNLTLTGSDQCFSKTLSKGKHWIGIIARSEGSLTPCTAGISVNDSKTTQKFELNAYKNGTNGAYTIKVEI